MRIEEKYLNESIWLPDHTGITNDKKIMNLVSKAAKELHYDIFSTAAFVIELMTDVNMHTEARQVNNLLVNMFSRAGMLEK